MKGTPEEQLTFFVITVDQLMGPRRSVERDSGFYGFWSFHRANSPERYCRLGDDGVYAFNDEGMDVRPEVIDHGSSLTFAFYGQ